MRQHWIATARCAESTPEGLAVDSAKKNTTPGSAGATVAGRAATASSGTSAPLAIKSLRRSIAPAPDTRSSATTRRRNGNCGTASSPGDATSSASRVGFRPQISRRKPGSVSAPSAGSSASGIPCAIESPLAAIMLAAPLGRWMDDGSAGVLASPGLDRDCFARSSRTVGTTQGFAMTMLASPRI